MKRLIRRLSRAAAAAGILRGGRSRRRLVPVGHVPVYVGEEMERFSVPADLLGRPAFVELLRRAAEEYGYEQVGVLRIPCPVPLFRRLLVLQFAIDEDASAGTELEEITLGTVSGEIRPSEVPC